MTAPLRDGYLRGYHRHEVDVDAPVPTEPVLFVSNHGFGGLVDLNVLAADRALRDAGVQRPTTSLVHQLAWTLGMGRIVEAMGGRAASKANADAAFEAGHNPPLPTKLHTAVMPAMTAADDESAEDFAARVQTVMQLRLDTLVAGRRPVIG